MNFMAKYVILKKKSIFVCQPKVGKLKVVVEISIKLLICIVYAS